MHALEIMNDKMDTGMVYQSLENELAMSPVVETQQDVIEIFDLILARLVSWHSGSNLIQTFLSCVYVEKVLTDLNRFEKTAHITAFLQDSCQIATWNQVLTAAILGFTKTIDLCIELMSNNNAIYPEEDIIGNKAGFFFLEGIDLEYFYSMLDASLAFNKKKGTGVADTTQIRHRLELVKSLLVLFRAKIPSKGIISNAKTSLSGITQITTQYTTKFLSAFSQSVQARATNASPLRPLTSVSVDESYSLLTQLVLDLEGLQFINSITRSTDLLSFFLTFSAKKPCTLPIVRAILKTSTIPNLLGQSLKSWMIKDIEEISYPNGHAVLKPKSDKIKYLVDPFLQEAELCYKDLLTVFCQNRSRQRQNLAHCILSWDSLQVSAERLEDELARLDSPIVPNDVVHLPSGPTAALPITSWVYMHKLQIMIWVVLLGFELNVYKLWEFSRMYLYAHALVEELNRHLTRLRTYLEQKVQASSGGSARPSLEVSHAYICALEIESMALDQLCQASLYLCVAYEKAGLLTPPCSVTTPELMYGLRMKPFSSVGAPGMPTYQEYVEFCIKVPSSEMALKISKNLAGSCRSLIDNLGKVSKANPELELLKRSSLGVVVAGIQLEKVKEGEKPVPILKSDGYHWFFPVISL